ncbi:MAG: hypothetical protein RL596_1848, partial [Bacteroidota bacterium]
MQPLTPARARGPPQTPAELQRTPAHPGARSAAP